MVYIVECADGSFYTGITSDIERRISEHNTGIDNLAYTFKRRPVVLKWYERFTAPRETIKVEKQLKGWSKRKKKALIKENLDKLVQFSENYTQHGSSTSSD
ncbi:putative endonuclease [Zhouia amylolytica]|uniref:Putative endonuclease n=1 Tax=Zhouia amylolytica TaxID=376730 RepID=A0A1I6PQY6_9FLAO|nr:GIY-YIG nuclease family protein [Zhouia amylolytica]SFS42478.1 putative endonuclease [Zhouia amylolytica]